MTTTATGQSPMLHHIIANCCLAIWSFWVKLHMTRRFCVMGGCCHFYLSRCDLLYMTGRLLIANIWYFYFGILVSVCICILSMSTTDFLAFPLSSIWQLLWTVVFYQRSQLRRWLSQPPVYSSASLGGKYAQKPLPGSTFLRLYPIHRNLLEYRGWVNVSAKMPVLR